MTVIRGATTIEKDTKEEITGAVKELLDEIFSLNFLSNSDVKVLVFSLTTDIHSYHPAKAARECGYDGTPLFACTEPDITGGLPYCIRVMVFIDRVIGNNEIKHIYQRGAKKLRKDLAGIFNIALDGPAGSGKSTIAKILAKDYGILYLDTGAMYRACALKALREKIDPSDVSAVEKMISGTDLRVEYKNGTQHTLLDGEDVSDCIRQNEVSMAASNISAHRMVREKMVEMQRRIAKNMSCVLDGRDIGSTVLPDAMFKFYIVADSRVRAMRRFKELKERGENPDFDILKKEIETRDRQDSEREFSPLKKAEDAIVVDTTELDIDQAVSAIKSLIQSQI